MPHPSIYQFGKIAVDITHLESHRCCTVLYCTQFDEETDGTRHNEDSTYGIGRVLQCIDIKEALSKCKNLDEPMDKLLD